MHPAVPEGPLGVRRPPLVISDDTRYSLDHLDVPTHYKPYLDSVLIPHGLILDRVLKLADDINQDYVHLTPHMLVVLKGSSGFFHDLQKAMFRQHIAERNTLIPFTYDFVKVSSYSGTASTGQVNITGVDLSSLEGRHVIVVEDMIDTGLTMTKILELLQGDTVRAASVRVVALLEKRTPRSCGLKADYAGFEVPDAFVVGYSMDYEEVFRDMQHVCIINERGIQEFRSGLPSCPSTPTPAADAGASPTAGASET